MIKQKKVRFEGVGGDREGKMTDLGSTGCSGCDSTLNVPEHTRCLQLSTEVNPPVFSPPGAVTTLLPLLQLVWMFACVCVSPLFFPGIPVPSREALDSAAGRQDLKLHPESHWKKAAILSERDLLQFFVSITSCRGCSGPRRCNFVDISLHYEKTFP